MLRSAMAKQPTIIKGRIRLQDFDPGYCDGLDKRKTKVLLGRLGRRIGKLQARLYANANCAVLLIFQGMDASGKDGAVRSVFQHVNPAGVTIANFKVPTDLERAHDFLWRIHQAVPRFGYIGVFNRSHYEAVLAERVLGIVPRKVWRRRYRQIVDFERMLVENDLVVLKFHLLISRDEQAVRFRERLANPKKYWKFSHADLTTRQLWDDYHAAYEDMINATSHAAARWHVVPSDHNWYRDYVVADTLVRALEKLHLRWPKLAKGLAKVRIK